MIPFFNFKKCLPYFAQHNSKIIPNLTPTCNMYRFTCVVRFVHHIYLGYETNVFTEEFNSEVKGYYDINDIIQKYFKTCSAK